MLESQNPRLNTPDAPQTTTHGPNTLQEPSEPTHNRLEFLKPSLYKPEVDKRPKASKAILDALSNAGLLKPSTAKNAVMATRPDHRKAAISIVDGKDHSIIHENVPSRLLIKVSSKAAKVFEAKPSEVIYIVHKPYDPAAMSGVINSITLSQKFPVSEDLTANLRTYEACVRLSIESSEPCLKPLRRTINTQISNKSPDLPSILEFVTNRLGRKDGVFKHVAFTLCHQRYHGQVDDLKAFNKMVARRPQLQKMMVQIDQDHKARRGNIKASKIKGKKNANDELLADVTLKAASKMKNEAGVKQKAELLKLLTGESSL